jgi:hypothetical protein
VTACDTQSVVRATFASGLVLIVFVLGGCGASAGKDGVVTVRLSDVDAAMAKAQTLRWEGDSKVTGHTATHATGEIDWPNRFVTMRSTSGINLDVALAQRGGRGYLRGPTGKWCWSPSLVWGNAAVNPLPFGTLDALRRSGARFDYIGQEKLRGVETGHFHVVGAHPLDLWVDSQDQLRRMAGKERLPKGTLTFTDDFFDFGTPVHAALPPSDAPKCEPA